jgi:uncharacterized cupin superfamily protein
MPGSFVVNVADAAATEHPVAGVRIDFDRPDAPFPDTGINIQVLRPGQPSCKYHAESVQEDFLVLAGECLVLLDGEERTLGAWDFVHCEPGSVHVFVGAGDGPFWILQIGARREGQTLDFPADESAARHGAAAPATTTDGDEAYADWPGGPPPGASPPVTPPWPPR